MQQIELAAEPRTETGKGPNYRLRAAGRIPAVIYGAGQEPEKVSISYREFERVMKTPDVASAIINVTGIGSPTTAVLREVQRDPVTRRYLHVDLFRVRMDVEGVFDVSVHGEGNPIGVREGGILETHLRTVQVRCLPANLPTGLHLDISGLKINASAHASDLQLPAGVTLVTEPTEVLFTVVLPQSGAITAAEGESGQPEVVGKKKEE